MSNWAHVIAGIVFETTTISPVGRFAADMVWVECDSTPGVAQGWAATEAAGVWTFTAPVVAAAAAQTPAQILIASAKAALAAGMPFASIGTPAVNATYPIDPENRADMLAEMACLAKSMVFTNGTTSLIWFDLGGSQHTFTPVLFEAFAVAAGAYVGALKFIVKSGAGSLPAAPAPVA